MARESLVVLDRATTGLTEREQRNCGGHRELCDNEFNRRETKDASEKTWANDSVLYGLKLSENLEQR
jgi:hypothetical protein